MVKMVFAKRVKYEGEIRPANVAFMVKPADVEQLKAVGGWIKEEPKAAIKPEPVEVITAEESDDPIADAEPVEEAPKQKKAKPRKAE